LGIHNNIINIILPLLLSLPYQPLTIPLCIYIRNCTRHSNSLTLVFLALALVLDPINEVFLWQRRPQRSTLLLPLTTTRRGP
jgi:hypothetical protein